MRAIIVILLAAVVGSRAEAEAEPSYGHGYTGSVLSHRLGHGIGYGHRLGYGHGYSGYVQPARSYVSHHRLYKREADPEPEAEASYGLQHLGLGHSGYTYGTSHPTYGYPAYGYLGYGRGYGYPTAHSYVSVHRVHKREADPEPAAEADPEPSAEADPSYGYSHLARGYGYPSYGYRSAYGSATSYVAPRVHGARLGYSPVHRVYKREADPEPAAEADPEPAAEADPSYGYSHLARGYGYPSYGYRSAYGSATSYVAPRVHGATLGYSPVHRVYKREADPEPAAEADPEPAAEADPSYGYSHVARGYGYPSYGYRSAATSYVAPRVHGARLGYSPVHRVYKREADPEPAAEADPEPAAEADPSYGYSHVARGYGYPSYGYRSAATSYVAPRVHGARLGYSPVHRVYKREADPEPAAEADPSYGYSHVARGYGYPSYGYRSAYGTATSYVAPRVHGARLGYSRGW